VQTPSYIEKLIAMRPFVASMLALMAGALVIYAPRASMAAACDGKSQCPAFHFYSSSSFAACLREATPKLTAVFPSDPTYNHARQ
jgi:hypothetical protein